MFFNFLKKNLVYILANFNIMFKGLVEYKTNFFVSIIDQLGYYITYIVFFYILSINFSFELGWDYKDLILYALFIDIIYALEGIFYWGKNLFLDINQGNLNVYLVRPLNLFFSYYFHKLSAIGIIFLIMNFLSLIIVFYLFNLNLTLFTIFICFLYLVLIFISYFMYKVFINGINFYFLGSVNFFNNLDDDLYLFSRGYPIVFFNNFKYKLFIMLYPMFFVGKLIIPVMKNDFTEILFYTNFLFLLILFFTIGSFFLWSLGIRNYTGNN